MQAFLSEFLYIASKGLKRKSMKGLKEFSLEFHIKTTARLLYTMVSTPEGLSRWFADNVVSKDGVYHFKWPDSEQSARLVFSRENECVRFQWLDDFHKDYVMEMQIISNPLSPEVALMITDFAEPADLDFSQRLWEAQVKKLQRLFQA